MQLPNKQRVSGYDMGDVIDLKWDEGDQILVTVGDKSAVFTLTSGAGTGSGTFTGQMPAAGTEYSVSYPVNYSDDVLTNQTYVENGFGKGLMKLSTKTNGTIDDGFTLSADDAVLGLQLTGSHTFGRIVLTNIKTDKAYTLHCDGVTLKENESTLFYIVVPAGEWTNGMRVEVYDKDGKIILLKEKTGEIRFSTTEAMVMPALQTRERNKRIGVFSVGEGMYVSFSQGNLQYIQSTKTWQFANYQWEYLGEENIVGGKLADKIDLFGWSGNNTTAPFGVSSSTNNANYSGEFVDWGINIIQGDAANTWRTLSRNEWEYLIKGRKNAANLIGVAQVNGVNGLIILPDEWECPDDIVFKQGFHTDFGVNYFAIYQTFNLNQWLKMETSNAVFLSTAGWRNGKTIDSIQRGVHYWSSTPNTDNYAYYFSCSSKEAWMNMNTCSRAFSIRLVHDTIVP